ncbi:hypothetical protein [Calycomorphotria hydatis]|uniref:Uncharacterized protein n=1 Tax=Calycomorphotria hydatis TaxID=2528027 RepID=A0A517TCF3_9PLAN|nr:hypothetical protein [Calycomorphotria hydatis]QDT66041.1 hypothetical protein V22_33050 [Calycomorphotria hydatis]
MKVFGKLLSALGHRKVFVARLCFGGLLLAAAVIGWTSVSEEKQKPAEIASEVLPEDVTLVALEEDETPDLLPVETGPEFPTHPFNSQPQEQQEEAGSVDFAVTSNLPSEIIPTVTNAAHSSEESPIQLVAHEIESVPTSEADSAKPVVWLTGEIEEIE